MKKLPALLLCLSIFLLNCKSKAKTEAAEKDSYEKAKESLEEKEKKNPTAFLKVSGKDKHNLLGQTVINGMITNNAKICTYKDVEIELSFFSKTGVLLEKDSEIVYEVIDPGKSADFKSKYFAPKGTDSVGIKILQAKTK
jgi:hypothetical protein